MKYFFFKADIEEGVPASYYELDKKWYIIRSIIILPDSVIGSNQPYYKIPGQEYYDLTIPEGPHDPSDLMEGYEDEIVEITKEEFDTKWRDFLNSQINRWEKTKARFEIGSRINGLPKMYYPQGIIVEVELDVYGIIPRKILPLNENVPFKIGQQDLNLEIISYEEKFHWLVLNII